MAWLYTVPSWFCASIHELLDKYFVQIFLGVLVMKIKTVLAALCAAAMLSAPAFAQQTPVPAAGAPAAGAPAAGAGAATAGALGVVTPTALAIGVAAAVALIVVTQDNNVATVATQ